MDTSLSSASVPGTTSSHEYRAGWHVWIHGFFGILLMLTGLAGIGNMLITGVFLTVQLIASGAALAIGAGFIFLWYRDFTMRVQVYEHGLSYTRGNKTRNFRWNEIEAIWQHIVTYRVRVLIFYIPISTAHKYTIRNTDGETIKFTETIGKIGELGSLIQQQVLNHMMPRAIET